MTLAKEFRLDAMSEQTFMDAVATRARARGFLVYHARPARTQRGGAPSWETAVAYDGAGFPDLVLVHPARRLVLFWELKTKRGRLSDHQITWGEVLTAAGANYSLLRPADWDHIEGVLDGLH